MHPESYFNETAKPMTTGTEAVRHGVNIVLGYGRFGRLAVKFLQGSLGNNASILVVDSKPQNNVPDDVQFVCAEAVAWLVRELHDNSEVQRIIPALPVHFAVRWLTGKLIEEGWRVIPCTLDDSLLAKLPHHFRLNQYSATTSHADFLCPVNCAEPEDICSYTGQKRPEPLNQILNSLASEQFTPLIVRSRQFAPGVGGYYPEDLYALLHKAKKLANLQLLVGTACKCHGILDGMCVKK